MNGSCVLAADVGGTHTRVALADCAGTRYAALHEHNYVSAYWPDLAPLLQDFLASVSVRPTSACLAIAGPISEHNGVQQAQLTNLPWKLDSAQLARALNIPRLTLINDFAAIGHGIAALGDNDLLTLQAGKPQAYAPRAVLGAGTGLGQALLIWQQDHYAVLPTEGGHVDFAPQNEQQGHLLNSLRKEYGHVSWERLCSGAGLAYMYRFLALRRHYRMPDLIAQAYAHGDAAAAISQAALANNDTLARECLTEFVRIYGAQAGNLGLSCLAYGGVYIAGGIAAKILPAMTDGEFLHNFNAKGRMQALTRQMPLHIVTHPAPGLLGAALQAGLTH